MSNRITRERQEELMSILRGYVGRIEGTTLFDVDVLSDITWFRCPGCKRALMYHDIIDGSEEELFNNIMSLSDRQDLSKEEISVVSKGFIEFMKDFSEFLRANRVHSIPYLLTESPINYPDGFFEYFEKLVQLEFFWMYYYPDMVIDEYCNICDTPISENQDR